MVSLYIDDDPDGVWMNLGGTVAFYKAMAEIAEVTGSADKNADEKYGELYGVEALCEEAEGTSSAWRGKVAKQPVQHFSPAEYEVPRQTQPGFVRLSYEPPSADPRRDGLAPGAHRATDPLQSEACRDGAASHGLHQPMRSSHVRPEAHHVPAPAHLSRDQFATVRRILLRSRHSIAPPCVLALDSPIVW